MVFLIGNMKRAKTGKVERAGILGAAILSFFLFGGSYVSEVQAAADNTAHCHAITNSQQRLLCYDRAAADEAEHEAEAVAVPIPFDMNSKTHAPQQKPMSFSDAAVKRAEEKAQKILNSAQAQEQMAVMHQQVVEVQEQAVEVQEKVQQKAAEAAVAPAEKMEFIRLVEMPVEDVNADDVAAAADEAFEEAEQAEAAAPAKTRSRFQTYGEAQARDVPVLKEDPADIKVKVAVQEVEQEAVAAPVAVKAAPAVWQASKSLEVAEKKEDVSCAPASPLIEIRHEEDELLKNVDMKRQIVELARQEEEEMDKLVEEIDEYVSEEEVFVEALQDEPEVTQTAEIQVAMADMAADEVEEEFFVEYPGDLTNGRMAGGGKSLRQNASFVPRVPQAVASGESAVFQTASYDGVAGSSSAATVAGDWKLFKEVNPLDDTYTLSLLREAEGYSEQWGDVPYLVLRCKSKQMDLYVVWHDPVRHDLEIVSRVGKDEAEVRRWSISTDGRASFYPNNPISFIKRLKNTDRFIVQATPMNKNPVTAIFDLSGLQDAVKPLQSGCHWR